MQRTSFIIESKKRENNETLIKNIKDSLISFGFSYDESNPELVLVLGGDGSLMRAVHIYGTKPHYLLINTGHLGFYSDYGAEEIDGFIADIKDKDATLERLPFYEVYVDGKRNLFLNDFAIQSSETCFIDISVDKELLTKVRSNGIVVSTPIGTTGYLTSLSSPVVIGNPKIYQYSTIAPCYNRLSLNPINKAILNNDDVLEVSVREGIIETYLDGIERPELVGKEYLFSGKCDEYVNLVHLRSLSMTRRLRKNISGMED